MSIKEYKKYKENVSERCGVIAAATANSPPKDELLYLPSDAGTGRRKASVKLSDIETTMKAEADKIPISPDKVVDKTPWVDKGLSIDSKQTEGVHLFTSDFSDTRKGTALKETFYAPTLDIVRDRAHHFEGDTIIKRIKSKQLPGACWSEVGRWPDDQMGSSTRNTGPGYYEVYPSQLTWKGVRFTAAVDREDPANAPPPKLKERLRLARKAERQTEIESSRGCLSRAGSLSTFVDDTPLSGLDKNGKPIHPERKVLHSTKFNTVSRWECLDYRQEPYVKTGGMTLGQDYDKKSSKIQFAFSTGLRKAKEEKSEGGEVDVDVGHFYSVVGSVAKSKIKYSAAFNNNTPVGMHIPPTTSPDHIGPGYFGYPNHFQGLSIRDPHKQSPMFQRKRPPYPIREAAQNSWDPGMLSFGATNKKGITFSKEGEAFDKNAELARIVQDKYMLIYPRAAKEKFPQCYTQPPRPKAEFYPPEDEFKAPKSWLKPFPPPIVTKNFP